MSIPLTIEPSYLDHDFNNQWGLVLGADVPSQKLKSNAYWADFHADRVRSERRAGTILGEYTDMFEAYFDGLLPISFHAHVNDALQPTMIASMLMRLALFSRLDKPEEIPVSKPGDRAAAISLLGWKARHVAAPRWAVLENSYSGAYGQLDIATGTPSILIRVKDQLKEDLARQLDDAVDQGCIGLLVEIVGNQHNGRVILPSKLALLSRLCAERGLVFAIDETVSAIRCGAPFAFQRHEYRDALPPDLVFFGKGLLANGVAINFAGPFISRFNISEPRLKRLALVNWQNLVTQALPTLILIQAIGVLEMAATGNWTSRSAIIGTHLRNAVLARARELNTFAVEEDDILGGLGSFIFVRIDVAATFLVMGASNAGPWIPWVRWLPRLDYAMTQRDVVDAILGPKSRSARELRARDLEKEGFKPQWCFWCGNKAINVAVEWCRRCCVNVCETDECAVKLRSHVCFE